MYILSGKAEKFNFILNNFKEELADADKLMINLVISRSPTTICSHFKLRYMCIMLKD